MVFPDIVPPATVASRLREENDTFAGALATDQVRVVSPEDVHLAGGYFDQHRMLAGFAQAVTEADADGYDGLRVSVDMTWAQRPVPGVEQLFDFEATANRLFPQRRLAAVCRYDRRRFDAEAIRRARAAHPITPGVSMLRFSLMQTPGLALSGQVDVNNHQALTGLLGALPDTDITMDLTGLTFADARTLTLIGQTAAARVHRTTLRCGQGIAGLLHLLDIDQVATIAVA
jgi:hypothetical protein